MCGSKGYGNWAFLRPSHQSLAEGHAHCGVETPHHFWLIPAAWLSSPRAALQKRVAAMGCWKGKPTETGKGTQGDLGGAQTVSTPATVLTCSWSHLRPGSRQGPHSSAVLLPLPCSFCCVVRGHFRGCPWHSGEASHED